MPELAVIICVHVFHITVFILAGAHSGYQTSCRNPAWKGHTPLHDRGDTFIHEDSFYQPNWMVLVCGRKQKHKGMERRGGHNLRQLTTAPQHRSTTTPSTTLQHHNSAPPQHHTTAPQHRSTTALALIHYTQGLTVFNRKVITNRRNILMFLSEQPSLFPLVIFCIWFLLNKLKMVFKRSSKKHNLDILLLYLWKFSYQLQGACFWRFGKKRMHMLGVILEGMAVLLPFLQ